MQNITDTIAYTNPVQSVADGDAASGANFLVAPQGLANRTAWLKNVLATVGVNLIMSGNAAAMQAVTPSSHPAGVANGSVFFVLGQGIYRYVSAGGATVDNSLVYAATGMGSGQWQHELLSLANVNLGFAAIGPVNGSSTAANKIPPSVQTNCLISVSRATATSSQTITGGGGNVDITSMSVTVPNCQVGDILLISADFTVNTPASGNPSVFINANGTQVQTGALPMTSMVLTQSIHATYTVAGAGSIVVKGQASGATSFTMSTAALQNLIVQQIRP